MPQPKTDRTRRALFETRTHSWKEAGLARAISGPAVRRARLETIFLAPLFVVVSVANNHREKWFGLGNGTPLYRLSAIAAAVVLTIIGWALARDIGRGLGPALLRRMEPAAAGTVGFLIRLAAVAIALAVAVDAAGVNPQTLALGGAFTAVIFGLAAQQTLGNLIAGMVLLSARPFHVGDRVRLQGGAIAGQIEGVVSSLGLLYTTFAVGDDAVMVPNNVVLSVSVAQLYEPDSVDVRARLRGEVSPSDLQAAIERAIATPIRGAVAVKLVEIDGAEVVMEISATPLREQDGARLASEVLEAVSLQSATSDNATQRRTS